MKTINKVAFIGIAIVILSSIFPEFVIASTTGGGGIGGELEITNILDEIIEFLNGPVVLSLLILGFIVGGATIAISRQNDQAGWNRLGKVIVGGTVALGAVGVATLFFSGAVI